LDWRLFKESEMALFSECMPGVLEERLTLPTLLETPDYNTWKSIHRANPLFSGLPSI
jgi:hypothetical protein